MPVDNAGWFVVAGMTEAGERIDLSRAGASIQAHRPERLWEDFRSNRWRILKGRLRDPRFAGYREPFLRFRMREWNDLQADPARRVVSAELIEMRYPIRPESRPDLAEPIILSRFP